MGVSSGHPSSIPSTGSKKDAWVMIVAVFALLSATVCVAISLTWNSPDPQSPRGRTPGGIQFLIPLGFTALAKPPEYLVNALRLSGARAYVPLGGEREGTAIVGESSGDGPQLLALGEHAAMWAQELPKIVSLGAGYIGVRVKAIFVIDHRLPVTITSYALPLTGATINVICVWGSRRMAQAFLEACGGMANTLEIPPHYGRPIQPGTLLHYRHVLRYVLGGYSEVRARLRRQLHSAVAPSGVRHAASQLAQLCTQTIERIDSMPRNPISRPAQEVLRTALLDDADAYQALALSARTGDTRTYNQARSEIGLADTSVREILRSILAP